MASIFSRFSLATSETASARVEKEPMRTAAQQGGGDETTRLGIAVRPLTPEEKKQVETEGSLVVEEVSGPAAVAGLQDVVTQQRMATPKPVWNPDVKQPIDFYAGWQPVPETQTFDNGFKLQWEAFIRHVAEDAPYKWDLVEGAKGVQLVECVLRSWKERRWVDVPDLKV